MVCLKIQHEHSSFNGSNRHLISMGSVIFYMCYFLNICLQYKMVVKLMEFFRIARRYEKRVPFIIAFVAVLIAYALPKAEMLNLIIFVILTLIFSIFRFDPRILIAYAIFFLVIAGALQFWESDYSSQMAVLSFWLLSAGVVCLIIDLYRRTRTIGLVT
jgi:hypothetical protein